MMETYQQNYANNLIKVVEFYYPGVICGFEVESNLGNQ